MTVTRHSMYQWHWRVILAASSVAFVARIDIEARTNNDILTDKRNSMESCMIQTATCPFAVGQSVYSGFLGGFHV